MEAGWKPHIRQSLASRPKPARFGAVLDRGCPPPRVAKHTSDALPAGSLDSDSPLRASRREYPSDVRLFDAKPHCC